VSHALNLVWAQHSRSETKIREFDVSGTIDEEVLWLQITMNIPETVQRVHTREHLCNVESSMSVVQHSSIVEQCAEVSSWNIFHRQIDLLIVLEGVEQSHQPLRLRSSQDISLRQDMSHLIQLEQQFLPHDFQRADLPSVSLLCQVDLTITTLTDLREDLEVAMSKACAALSESLVFSGKMVRSLGFECCRVCDCGQLLVDSCIARLSIANVREEIVVVVEEV
jgi:hypothetical protein